MNMALGFPWKFHGKTEWNGNLVPKFCTSMWEPMVQNGDFWDPEIRSWDISGRYHWVMVGQSQKPSHEE
jgi:hypothetical protein